MSTKTKLWLIVATIMTALGLVLFAGAMSAYGWNFYKLSTVTYETNNHTISDEFDSIEIITDTADICFTPSEDETCSVVCYEEQSMIHPVFVRDNILVIGETDTRNWYDYIGINFGTPKITVYLPAGQYDTLIIKESTGDVDIPNDFQFESIDISTTTGDIRNFASASEAITLHANTGDIQTESISAKSLDLSVSTGWITAKAVTCEETLSVRVSTGKVQLANVVCGNLTSSGDTGDLTMQNVIAQEAFSIVRDTGDVTLDGCDAGEISIRTDTGDVRGSLLTEKTFMAQTDTGRVSVPHTTTGGVCEIITDTGDIEISIN